MPIYRAERHVASFSSEPGAGGYLDYIATYSDAGGASSDITANATPGDRRVTVASNAGYAIGDYVVIGSTTAGTREVRRVAGVSGATIIILDYPLGFYHSAADAAEIVDEATLASPTVTGNSLMTFIPGVWETIDTPDMTTEIIPQYFLGVASNRNPYAYYRGRQAFTGRWSPFVLLNGIPLRFPIGAVRTTRATEVAATLLSGAHFKGQRAITVALASTYVNGDYVTIEQGGTNPEVRQIISGSGSTTLILNYPLMFDHDSSANVHRATTGIFTHTIVETTALDSMSWNLMLRDSSGTTANDWIRRWLGGKVNSAVISADEGGMLRMAWDDVVFLDMVHNQTAHSAATMVKSSLALLQPATVGSDLPHSGDAFGSAAYPTTQPYYFSQGTISFFGVTFARIRSFSLSIANNLTPFYYIRNDATDRIPAEITEQRREYRLSATVALPDSISASATTRTLFKELLLEGNYTAGFQGFDISLTFSRASGTDDITITIPPSAASTGGDAQGAFIVRGQQPIGTDSPVQASIDMTFRSMQIVIRDNIGVYP